MVLRLSWRFGSGQETLPEFWKWSGDRPGGLELVRDPKVGPEVVRRPSQRSGRGQDTLL